MANEKRLIDADALLESIEGTDWYTITVDGSATQGATNEEVAWYKATDIYAAVENAPTVDAVEVVHGRWERNKNYDVVCSICKNEPLLDEFGHWDMSHYCPNCGAKMDGGNEDG